MKVIILRTPGQDLLHDLAIKGIEMPDDCVEGETRDDLNDEAVEALVELGVVKLADAPAAAPKHAPPRGGRGHEPPKPHEPAKQHEPHKQPDQGK